MRCFVALSLPDPARVALSRLSGTLARRWPSLSWTKSEGYHLTLAFLGEIDEGGLACASAALARLDECAFSFRFSEFGGFPPRGLWRVLYAGIDDVPGGGPYLGGPVPGGPDPGGPVPGGPDPGDSGPDGSVPGDSDPDSAASAGARPSPARRIYSSFNEALAAEASERGLGRLNAEWRPEGGGRDFVPHVTLARLPERRRGGRGAHKDAREGAREGGIRGRGAQEGPTASGLAELSAQIASALAGQWTIERCSLYKSELGRGGAVYTEQERRLLRPAPA